MRCQKRKAPVWIIMNHPTIVMWVKVRRTHNQRKQMNQTQHLPVWRWDGLQIDCISMKKPRANTRTHTFSHKASQTKQTQTQVFNHLNVLFYISFWYTSTEHILKLHPDLWARILTVLKWCFMVLWIGMFPLGCFVWFWYGFYDFFWF